MLTECIKADTSDKALFFSALRVQQRPTPSFCCIVARAKRARKSGALPGKASCEHCACSVDRCAYSVYKCARSVYRCACSVYRCARSVNR